MLELLKKELDEGTITPEEAVKQFEQPGSFLKDIEDNTDSFPLDCGFPTFDENQYLRKNQPDLVIIAGRPGHGKTALASQIAAQVAKDRVVHFFSLEMPAKQIKQRFIAQESGKSIKMLSTVHPSTLKEATDRVNNLLIHLDDTSGLDINQIMKRATEIKRQHNTALIVIDYAQIIASEKQGLKAETVSHVVEKLKTLAKELNTPVLTLAQMNRMFEMRLAENPEAEPIMADLADSAGLERWADVVIALHKKHANYIKGYVIKNRNGAMNNFEFRFNGEILKFYDSGSDI